MSQWCSSNNCTRFIWCYNSIEVLKKQQNKKWTFPCRVRARVTWMNPRNSFGNNWFVSVPKSCSDETTKQNCRYRRVRVSQQKHQLAIGRILISRGGLGLGLLLGLFDYPAAWWNPIWPKERPCAAGKNVSSLPSTCLGSLMHGDRIRHSWSKHHWNFCYCKWWKIISFV